MPNLCPHQRVTLVVINRTGVDGNTDLNRNNHGDIFFQILVPQCLNLKMYNLMVVMGCF